jgi:flagellar biosynthetic protein FliO
VAALGLLLRVGVAMAVVVAVMWVAARLLQRRVGPSARGGQPPQVEVLARRGLSRNSSVAVVRVGGRTLILGVTDAQVSLLAETGADTTLFDLTRAESGTLSLEVAPPPAARTPLVESLRERTVRR